MGGQRLELPLGRTVDGECQVRVIDEPAPIVAIACGANILVQEGDAGLDGNAISSGDWVVTEFITGTPNIGFGENATNPFVAGFILFNSGQYTGYMERTFDGTESGGPAWSPGDRVGVHYRVSWFLDTGPGNIFTEVVGGPDPLNGGSTTSRVSYPNGSFDFWTITPDLAPNVVFDGYQSGIADSNGELAIRLGAENYGGSCNVNCHFTDIEFVSCEPITVSIDSERYTTASLADDAARQRMLGRQYVLKASTDGGFTWDETLYVGYLRQITLDRALTFLMTGGDSGRGRRVGRAWRGLDPIEDFVP
jgi:hypothetical protein